MRVTWRDRLRQHPRLADLSSWPPLDPSLVPAKNRKQFLRNTRVVKEVLSGLALADAAKFEGLSPGRVTQLLNRCLGGDPERPPPASQRSVAVSSGGRSRRGRARRWSV